MSDTRLRVTSSRSGHANIEIDGAPYHSQYDPVREARKYYADLPIEKADVILLFGWGLGYSSEALIGRLKSTARVIVFEPDDSLFRQPANQTNSRFALQDPRFQFVVGPEVCRFFDESTLEECQDTDEILWISWPAAARFHPEVLDTLKQKFRFRLRDRAANLLTHFDNGATYFRNVFDNVNCLSDPDVRCLFNRFAGVPVVIVSAGPSLDRNIRELRGMETRCMILAVDTALRPLLSAGITPHAVILADPSELNARHVIGAIPESTYLIAEQAAHGSALQAASRRFLFGLGLFPDPLFAKFGIARSTLEVWGSVATAALDLACRMGADPIVFIGQDFAYSWNTDYASHTIFEGNSGTPSKRNTMEVRDIWGRPVPTTENLAAYRDFFVRRMRRSPNVRFINATEGGILNDGVEILSLKHVLHRYCDRTLDVSAMIEACTSNQPPAGGQINKAIEHMGKALRDRSRDCGCLESFLELTAKEFLLKKDAAAIDGAIRTGLAVVDRLTASVS